MAKRRGGSTRVDVEEEEEEEAEAPAKGKVAIMFEKGFLPNGVIISKESLSTIHPKSFIVRTIKAPTR